MTARKFVLLLGLVSAMACQAQVAPAAGQVICRITYGGETQEISASPVASPYPVKAIQVGSYFLFRAVVQDAPADIASIKLYVYGDSDDGPVIIHQADHPYPPLSARSAPFGFTGLQRVYETIRNGELEYWCSWQASRKSAQ